MSNETRISYILGAGASYGALPLVKELPGELNEMVRFIENYAMAYTGTPIGSNYFNSLKKEIEEIGQHYSIDTLARKYWLMSKSTKLSRKVVADFGSKYKFLKRIIAAYFTFKRLQFKGTLPDNYESISNATHTGERRVMKLDTRYDSFLSALMSSDLAIPDRINFISWNYDMQIEQSFSFFYQEPKLHDVGGGLGINYRDVTSSGNYLKLNGSASIYDHGKSCFLEFTEYNNETHSIFVDILSGNDPSKYSTAIKFAWELEEENDLTALAMRKISNSDFVVIIGYSFPIFNREVDIKLFSEVKNQQIFIQAPPEDYERLQNQLESIKTGLSNKAKSVINLDQFYIPNEFWNADLSSFDDYQVG